MMKTPRRIVHRMNAATEEKPKFCLLHMHTQITNYSKSQSNHFDLIIRLFNIFDLVENFFFSSSTLTAAFNGSDLI